MYRALVGVGLLCGLLIVSVYEITRPVIARNRAEALERGANAVVGLRFTTSMVMQGSAEILAYGTAVVLSAD